MSTAASAAPVRLKLPATSANLGPGFDALGLALDLSLHVEAKCASETAITASGRNMDVIQNTADSLILETYRDVLQQRSLAAPPLALTLHNEIPLGMGCGSSAAALVAGVALASHFGGLRWDRHAILTEASRREGHPDNVAACVLGGLTASAMQTGVDGNVSVQAVSLPIATPWRVLVAMPSGSLSTKTARALLPDHYSRPDAIANVQSVALLIAAFATGRGDLLRTAMADRMHQPYRSGVCPLLPVLLPMSGTDGVLGVALSGAGPSVLLMVGQNQQTSGVTEAVTRAAATVSIPVEIVETGMGQAANFAFEEEIAEGHA